MDLTTLETLEFPAVLKEVAAFAATPLGSFEAAALKPESSFARIQKNYQEYSQAADLLKASGKLPLGGATDITPLIDKLGPEGAFLLPEELLFIKNNLAASRLVRALNTQSFSKLYPLISEKIGALSEQSALYSELNRIVDEKAQIKDTASPNLFRIRKEIRAGKDRARGILEAISTDKKFKEMLQEDIITIRDDRYVLLIKAGMHTGLDGVIHGRSGSGATFFMEPLQLVELNNKVAVLKKEEKAEEIEILKNVSAMIAAQAELLLSDQSVMASLDCLQAKALFGREIKATVPYLFESGEVRYINARHPLLILKEAKGGVPVVPIDIFIPEGKSVLVISGANTGGKTVALKTLGLLTLMALSAIPVPVDEGSTAVAFREIFSDIGDRQDIIASLSTFSAHVKRIREFLASAGPGSLVLMDEIGAGTDPSEGSALALASLETFRETGATTVVTTHLNTLKAQAQVHPEYINASVEFDENTLKPLYKLHYGIPGPSLGLAIAESLGIPSAIIERAKASITDKEGAFIASVRRLEEEKEEVARLRRSLEELEAKRRQALDRIKEKRDVILDKARAKIESAVNKAKDEIRETVERLKEEGARQPQAGGRKATATVHDIGERLLSKVSQRPKVKYIPAPGDKVAIIGSSSKGEVLSVDSAGKKAELRIGGLKVSVAWDKLIKRGSASERTEAAQAFSVDADMEVAQALNIIGMRAEEALPLVKKFLDNAHASGLDSVEVIHGVGTGKLGRAVHEYLKTCEAVKAFRFGDAMGGGAGVTVVELK